MRRAGDAASVHRWNNLARPDNDILSQIVYIGVSARCTIGRIGSVYRVGYSNQRGNIMIIADTEIGYIGPFADATEVAQWEERAGYEVYETIELIDSADVIPKDQI